MFETYNGKIHDLCLGLSHVVRYSQCLLSGLLIAVAMYVHTEKIHLVKGCVLPLTHDLLAMHDTGFCYLLTV